jgi:hypothetical protein
LQPALASEPACGEASASRCNFLEGSGCVRAPGSPFFFQKFKKIQQPSAHHQLSANDLAHHSLVVACPRFGILQPALASEPACGEASASRCNLFEGSGCVRAPGSPFFFFFLKFKKTSQKEHILATHRLISSCRLVIP